MEMHWTKGPIIGRGSTATVSLATTAAGDQFAVKSTELTNSSFLQKEQQLLSKLSSPHVIEYIGFDIGYVDNIPMYNLFMEYAPGGTISDIIKKQGGFLDECLIRSYTHNILLGLDYLHSNYLVHCDIKCSNILVFKDTVKIADLGCAKSAKNNSNSNSNSNSNGNASVFSGTPVFMSPEVARGEKQGFAADVWAVGCAIIEMATGLNAWPEIKDPVSALYRIGYSGEVPVFPMWLSEEAKDFLKCCLQRNDKERWTIKELLQHPFVNSDFSAKKIENFPKRSPSSILDQGFWDCFEEPEISPDPTRFMAFSGESPVNRIRELMEAIPVSSCLSNWVGEEDWITVRSNMVEENSNIIHEVEDDESESTRSDSESVSELYVEEGFTILVESIIEYSNVVETSDASIVISRFLDFKNIYNESCLLVDLNLNFASCLLSGSSGFS